MTAEKLTQATAPRATRKSRSSASTRSSIARQTPTPPPPADVGAEDESPSDAAESRDKHAPKRGASTRHR